MLPGHKPLLRVLWALSLDTQHNNPSTCLAMLEILHQQPPGASEKCLGFNISHPRHFMLCLGRQENLQACLMGLPRNSSAERARQRGLAGVNRRGTEHCSGWR